MNELDVLKSISSITEPDSRTKSTLSWFDPAKSERQFPTLAEHHASVADVVLGDHVPEETRVHFEVARNLYLYTFFVYRFGVAAVVQALQALEYGLRERAKVEGIASDRQTLGVLMKLALTRGWLRDDAFKFIPDDRLHGDNAYSRSLVKTLPGVRNILAHGSFTLFEPCRTLEHLRVCAAIINYIFDGTAGSTDGKARV